MRTFLIAVLLGGWVVTSTFARDNELTENERNQGFRLLFDGKSLDGWKSTGQIESWGVENGAIARINAGAGYLHTLDQFENFVLMIDYKVDPKVNSGIFFRWSNLDDPVNTGIEMQVYDSYGRRPDKHEDGAIYDIMTTSRIMSKPAGQWNHAVITCDGPIIRIELNGEKTCEINVDKWTKPGRNPDGTRNKFRYAYKDLPRRGYIGLQDHGGKVWFKNVKVREIRK